MKIAVSGYRLFTDYEKLKQTLDELKPTELLVGDCRGTDALARQYARECKIPCAIFKAEWHIYGKGAGPIRNGKMLDQKPDLLVAFVSKESVGTLDAIRQAKERDITVVEINID